MLCRQSGWNFRRHSSAGMPKISLFRMPDMISMMGDAFARALGYYSGHKNNIRMGPSQVGVEIQEILNARV